jgi:L-aminopeptidase/D-esterase-like protein
MQGNEFATKGGFGSASVDLGDGLIVAALMAVNAVGDVTEDDGRVIAGLRVSPDGSAFVGMMNVMKMMARMVEQPSQAAPSENTVIGVVATNARLTKEEINKVAQMAHDGLARAVRPAHTLFDGDTIFGLATGQISANANVIGAFAADMVAEAIRNAVRAAASLAGVRAWKD